MSVWRRVVEERRAVVVPIGVLFLANIGALMLGVLPLRRSVANLQETGLAVHQRLEIAKMTVGQAVAAKNRAEIAAAGLRTFYSDVLPQGFDEAVQVSDFWLTSVANSAGVRFDRGQYGYGPVEESGLWQMTAQAVLTGDYLGVRRFLHAVETARPFVIIDQIELAQPGDGSTTERMLELLLDVSTYYVGPVGGEGDSR